MREGHRKAAAAVATALWAVTRRRRPGKNGSQSRRYKAAFTLAELLVSVGVLVLLVLLATQLLNSAATITTLGHKQMDADSQARQLLDRMAIDFAQMVKRSDVDYYFKGAPPTNTQTGNDQIAFFTMMPGYYPSGPTTLQKSPFSLVAYRINAQNKLERMAKGLVWNGEPTGTPLVFLPLTIAGNWPTATNASPDTDYEEIGPQIFRFEYSYLLADGTRSIAPGNISGLAAILVDIAVIDSKSKVLLTDAQIATFTTPGAANFLSDCTAGMVPGQLRAQWQDTLNGITSLPRPAIAGIRLYERYFYLSPPTL